MLIYLFQTGTPEPRSFNPYALRDSLISMVESFLAHLPFLLMGLLVLGLFILVARLLRNSVERVAEKSGVDRALTGLLSRLVGVGTSILGIFVAATVIFPTLRAGDLIAALGIGSVAVGFAFKDILQNFFAGILLLWRRPFRIGDVISTGKYDGTVEEINLRSTLLKTPDGEQVVIPNGEIYTSSVLVKTAYPRRRLQFEVGIGYSDSIEDARHIILQVLRGIEGILEDPAPMINLSELAASSVNLRVYYWVPTEGFSLLEIRHQVATRIKQALDKADIDIPFPHHVLLLQDSSGTPEGEGRKSDEAVLARN